MLTKNIWISGHKTWTIRVLGPKILKYQLWMDSECQKLETVQNSMTQESCGPALDAVN